MAMIDSRWRGQVLVEGERWKVDGRGLRWQGGRLLPCSARVQPLITLNRQWLSFTSLAGVASLLAGPLLALPGRPAPSFTSLYRVLPGISRLARASAILEASPCGLASLALGNLPRFSPSADRLSLAMAGHH